MYRLLIGILLCFLWLVPHQVRAEDAPYVYQGHPISADSIMDKVIFFAPLYESIVDAYKAELYIKGRINIRKQNKLLKFIPTMFRIRKGVKEYMMETHNELSFTAPNIYDQKVTASAGTANEFWDLDGQLPEYFHINIYSSTILYDKLLSPLAGNAKKYYDYRIDSIWGPSHNRQYKIRFLPHSKSFQLVGGYMVVSDNVWSIREIRFSGRSEILFFSNHVRMGDVGAPDEFLPLRSDFEVTFKLVGNIIDGNYTAMLTYKDIRQHEASHGDHLSGKSKYDLSDSFTLRCDTNAYTRDIEYFNSFRPLPLTAHEDSLYWQYFLQNDTVRRKRKPKNKR